MRLLMVGLIATMIAASGCQAQQKIAKQPPLESLDYTKVGSAMPELRLYNPGSKKTYTAQDFGTDKSLIIMLFNPVCEHCEDQGMALRDSAVASLPNARIVLVAAEMMGTQLPYYYATTHTENLSYMPVTVDSSNLIRKLYQEIALPQLNIYDRQRKLVKAFHGVTTMDSLAHYTR
jgi:hypothetical protein